MLILAHKGPLSTDSIECWTAVRWATVGVVEKPPPPILVFQIASALATKNLRASWCGCIGGQPPAQVARPSRYKWWICKCNLFLSNFYHVFASVFFWNVFGPMPVVTFFFGLPIPAFHITRASRGCDNPINDSTSGMDEPTNSPAQPLRIDWSLLASCNGAASKRHKTEKKQVACRTNCRCIAPITHIAWVKRYFLLQRKERTGKY